MPTDVMRLSKNWVVWFKLEFKLAAAAIPRSQEYDDVNKYWAIVIIITSGYEEDLEMPTTRYHKYFNNDGN